MQRRQFMQLAGGGTLAAAVGVSAGLSGCSSALPPQAVEAWNGPSAKEKDPRRFALSYALLAPNPHNRQPWIADLREPGVITLLCDRERLLPQTDPFGRQILIGHGAFLELLVIALAEQGIGADVQLWPDGELPPALKDWAQQPVARVRLLAGGGTKPKPDPLFAQILRRHTPKVDFDTRRPVDGQKLAYLLDAAQGQGVKVAGTVDAAALEALRNLCWQSARAELLTPRTVMESVQLVRVGPQEILRHRDGISINSAFVRAIDSAGLFDRQTPPAEGSAAYKDMMGRFEGHSRTAMGFFWLSTMGNRRSDAIVAGRAYVRLQLAATQMGLGVHPMSQALQEFPEMQTFYKQAHHLLIDKPAPKGPEDQTVQMLCRLGYTPNPVEATPRRPLLDLLRT